MLGDCRGRQKKAGQSGCPSGPFSLVAGVGGDMRRSPVDSA